MEGEELEGDGGEDKEDSYLRKGCVGKTTLASLLAMAYAESGYNVITIDAKLRQIFRA